MEKIVIATGNQNKLKEIRSIFTGFEVFSQTEAGFTADVEETGSTFEENALIKARAVSSALGVIALADDSGLCVDALGGAPGVYSARYAGEHGNDAANRKKLLQALEGENNRAAHFSCAVALVFPSGKEITVCGYTYGKIRFSEEGTGGFGYDCIFDSDDLKKSFGVATPEEKNSVSHRGRALKALKEKLEEEGFEG